MSQELTNAEKIRRLPWYIALYAANNVFGVLTFFGPAFILFLSELKLNNTEIGFLLSLVPFTGLIALVIAPVVPRFGYKRTFVTFWGVRKIFAAGLLLVPWVLSQFGPAALTAYIAFIIGGFALCRAIGETGMYPWAHEFIPNSVRGRYSALNDIMMRLTGIASLAFGSFVLGLSAGIDRFLLLFAVGLVFGLIGVWSATHIPGGAPTRAVQVSYGNLLKVLRDRNFLMYVIGLSVLVIGSTPMGSFLPLFMSREVGLSDSQVVLLNIAATLGGLAATYLVGWAADRYGSKPLLLSGLYLKILMPLAWLLMPRESALSLPVALAVSAVNGGADIAWAIGSGRLLYVKVVPGEKKTEYMSVYYALMGLIGGLSQVAGGSVLDLTAGLSGQFLIFTIDPFFPLFVFGLILTAVSALIFRRVQADSPVSVGEFAGMFIHGNPILALESVFRYYRAKDERSTVVMTERMGQTKSPLTVDELLEALRDPRFNVRFEAIISIARMDSDPRLVDALCHILDGTELSLSVVAAWALGRMGDEQARTSLRHGLDSEYRSIRAHCARALGTLGDQSVVPVLIERLQTETDKGLRIAYSSALGNLKAEAAIPTLLDILKKTENEGARLELALAVARVIGQEHPFIRLLRHMRQDKGTAISQALMATYKHLNGVVPLEVQTLLQENAHVFAREDFEQGVALLVQIIRLLPAEVVPVSARAVLNECADRLTDCGVGRQEYLLLALHALDVAHA
ncbi:MAG: MFS transporter [Chloroflexi bacterium]|nr:MFS transporter [Chloroflexota bacterium]